MFPEQDKFYEKLPFTLPQQQSKPSYVILGTGLQECLIASHFSKIKMKPGLIIDIDKTYGGCLKTVTLKELHSLASIKEIQKLYTFYKLPLYTQSNEEFFQKCIETKAFRGYNIDIQPNYFFAESTTCTLLRQADMDKYMDFRLVSRMLYLDKSSSGKKVHNVPLSKGKIFESKSLSLMQKKVLLSSFHSLAQIYHKYMDISEDQNSTKQFDKGFGQVDKKLYEQFLNQKNQIFLEFLSQKITKKNQKILNYVVYIICNYQYSYKQIDKLPQFVRAEYTLQKFIQRFGKFLKSCGIYGEGPYLYVDNGIGDVPQSFSRIASIFGSTYILHPKINIEKIQTQQNTQKIKIFTNLYPEGYIETEDLYYGPTFYDYYQRNNKKTQIQYHKQFILRLIILVKKNQSEIEMDYPALTYIMEQTKNIKNPIYLFMFDQSSHTCPKQYLLYQYETVLNYSPQQINDNLIQEICQQVINLTAQIHEQFRQRIQYVTAYVRQKRYPCYEKSEKTHQFLLKDHNGIDLDSYFLNFKKVVGQSQTYFRKQENQKKQDEENEGIKDEETLDLIERLGQIDLKNKQQQISETKQQKQEKNDDC